MSGSQATKIRLLRVNYIYIYVNIKNLLGKSVDSSKMEVEDQGQSISSYVDQVIQQLYL